jgi:hypothetical protein
MYKELASGRPLSADKTAVFANSAAANTQKTIDISLDKSLIAGIKTKCQIAVYNPSTVTDLTVKIMSKESDFGGDVRYCLLDTWTVAKAATVTRTALNAYLKNFEGMFNGTDLRLVVSNVTILGASDGFTAWVRVREL